MRGSDSSLRVLRGEEPMGPVPPSPGAAGDAPEELESEVSFAAEDTPEDPFAGGVERVGRGCEEAVGGLEVQLWTLLWGDQVVWDWSPFCERWWVLAPSVLD